MNNQDLFEQTKPMESNSNKKVISMILVSIVVLFFLVIGSAYAYFSTTGENSTTNVTATSTTGSVGTVTIINPTSNLHVRVKETSMNISSNDTIYATDDANLDFVSVVDPKPVATLTVTGGDSNVSYICSFRLNISLSGTMVNSLQRGDAFLSFSGAYEHTFDLLDLNSYEDILIDTLSGTNRSESVNVTAYFVNRNAIQDYLQGKSLEITLNNTNLSCELASGSSTDTYTITFNTLGGTPISQVTVNYGDELGVHTTTKNYYNFVNWYSDSEFQNLVESTTQVYSDMTLYALWELDPIYCLQIGDDYYETFASAISSINDNTSTTINVLKNIDLESAASIPQNKIVTVDLKGHNIDNSTGSSFQIQSGGTLNIKDTVSGGEISGGVATNPPTSAIVNNGTMNIESGTITSNITNVISNSGIMNITGGVVTIGNVSQGIINNNLGAILNISGGEIKAEISGQKRQAIYNERGTVNISGNAYLYSNSLNRATVQNYNTGGVINITGGTIISNNTNCQRGAIQNDSGSTVNLYSGTVISKSKYTGTTSGYGPGGIQNEGTLVIGRENSTYDATDPVIQAEKFGINTSSTANTYMYDGIIKSKDVPIKGSLSIPSSNIEVGTTAIYGTEGLYNTLYYQQ